MIELTSETFDQQIKKEKTLVEFYGTHCPPCKMMLPQLEDVKGVTVTKINADDYPDISGRYMIMSTPTVIVFENGEPVNRQSGYMSTAQLESLL